MVASPLKRMCHLIATRPGTCGNGLPDKAPPTKRALPSPERGTQPASKRKAHGKSSRPVSSTLGVIQQISTRSDSLIRSDSLLSDAVGGQHKATTTSPTSSSLPMGAGGADSGSEAEPQCSNGQHCSPAAVASPSADAMVVTQQEPTVVVVVEDAPATASDSHQAAKPPPLNPTCDVTSASEGVVAADEGGAVGAAEEPAGVVGKGEGGTTTGTVAATSPEGGVATATEMEIPGILVGVVIGKGGESIRRLMDLSGAKMQMVAKHAGGERNYMLPQTMRVTGCVHGVCVCVCVTPLTITMNTPPISTRLSGRAP